MPSVSYLPFYGANCFARENIRYRRAFLLAIAVCLHALRLSARPALGSMTARALPLSGTSVIEPREMSKSPALSPGRKEL